MWIETSGHTEQHKLRHVTPHVGVWIETCVLIKQLWLEDVTPHVGVWIETTRISARQSICKSHLM